MRFSFLSQRLIPLALLVASGLAPALTQPANAHPDHHQPDQQQQQHNLQQQNHPHH